MEEMDENKKMNEEEMDIEEMDKDCEEAEERKERCSWGWREMND